MNFNSNLANVLEVKNLFYVFAKSANVKMPTRFLACQEGLYTDSNNALCFDKAVAYISDMGDCFAKPSIRTDSGNGCHVYRLVGGIDKISEKSSKEVLKELGLNFVLQERIKCHESIRNIYSGSVNTFRVMIYRWHDNVFSAPVIMRIGRGAFLDNAHAGGMFIAISEEGILHEKVFTEFNESFFKHPDSSLIFDGYKIDKLPEVVETVKKMHYLLQSIGVINWDMTIDENGTPTLIEANVNCGSIWLFQMAHGCGVFGGRTQEILQWICKTDKLNYGERIKHHFGD